jgi:hypothetical protein
MSCEQLKLIKKVPKEKLWELYTELNPNQHKTCPYPISHMREHICRTNLAMVKLHYEMTGNVNSLKNIIEQ